MQKTKNAPKINLSKISINQLVSELRKRQAKKAKVVKSIVQKYKTLESVYESEDGKKIIFDYKNDKFYFNVLDYKLYSADNKVLSKTIIDAIPTPSLSQIIQKINSDCWVKAFFLLIHTSWNWNNNFNFLQEFSNLKENKKKIFSNIEKLSKIDFVKNFLLQKGYGLIDDILAVFDKLKFNQLVNLDMKKFQKDYEWIIKHNNALLESNYGEEALSYYDFAKEHNLSDFFEYTFENYRIVPTSVILESVDYLVKIGYEQIRLADYVFRDLRNQGLDVNDPENYDYDDGPITCLVDYAKMNQKMNRDYEKYPRYLKTYHDIAQTNYKVVKTKHLKTQFKKSVSAYKKYEYKNQEYSVIIPAGIEDLVREGSLLNHCVGSYAEDIAEGLAAVVFLRKNNALKTPLVTIEINKNRIVQAKGKSNSNPQPEERQFLEEYRNYLKNLT